MIESLFNLYNSIPHFCIIEALTGLLCPFCDGMLALKYLFHFDLLASIKANPLVLFLISYYLVVFLRFMKEDKRLVYVVFLAFFAIRNLPYMS